MAGYTKTTWVNGVAPAIDETNLNHVETQYDTVKTNLELATGLSDIQVHGSNLVDDTVTDAKIGDRTISDASAPTGDTDDLTTLLGWLANMTKQMTGEANWRTSPDTTFVAAKAHIDGTTGVHGAVSTATANKIAIRDASGRIAVADGAAAGDCANKGQLDSHSTATTGVHGVGASAVESTAGSQSKVDTHNAVFTAHGAVSTATGSRIVLRDAAGRAAFADPSASGDAATKNYVDTHAALTNPHSATSAATASRLVLRDSSGRAKMAAPSADDDIARKLEVDAQIAKSIVTTKGDTIVATASATPARLAVGTDDQVLTADSTQAAGVKWGARAIGIPSGSDSPNPGTALDIVWAAADHDAWRSVGPTGSGAHHIWTDLDQVPAGAKAVIVAVHLDRGVSSVLEVVKLRKGGTAIEGSWVVRASSAIIESDYRWGVIVPVSASRTFEFYWTTEGVDRNDDIHFWLQGWIV